MDDFKKYLQEQASQMEFDEPGEVVWKNIAEKTNRPKQGSMVSAFIRFAAAACLIVIAGSVVWIFSNKQNDVVVTQLPQQNKVTKPMPSKAENHEGLINQRKELVKQSRQKRVAGLLSTQNAATAKRAPANLQNEQQQEGVTFQHIEADFSQLVNAQLNKLRSLPLYAEGPEYYSEFKKQFQQLEEDEKELKKAISRDGLTNERLADLINVSQQKLNLLKLLQNEINKTNSRYRQNNNSDSTNTVQHINI